MQTQPFVDLKEKILKNCSRIIVGKEEVIEQIDIQIKYEGYIRRQEAQVKQFKRMENHVIPEDIDYDKVESLRLEARQKLKSLRPANVGQASRIAGVSPADISVLLVYLSANGGV